MPDPNKREKRQEKREIKRAGNKRRRLALKRALEAHPEDAALDEPSVGRYRSSTYNRLDDDATRRRPEKSSAEPPRPGKPDE